ncbi:hypothetical protein LEN26_016232 [Aphanomyces euteiches]|nr:hypothetical protein LEN26_016232 [Aphanomyces euteiches]KAH9115801.1 hypothetical protein AeMF1_010180 [Aphanomyces euteiches]KAH9194089.1 hypothetical protein AeNC1_003940 [Aphanomyces euteiches]
MDKEQAATGPVSVETVLDGGEVESDDGSDDWVDELEEELVLEVRKKPRVSVVFDLPHEVLLNVFNYVSVGRVCKAWSLASTQVARTKLEKNLTALFDQFSADDAMCCMLAKSIEGELHAHTNSWDYSVSREYKEKARMLLFNLRDAKNDLLRLRLFSGELTAFTLVRLKSKDMANPQLVEQRKEWIRSRTAEVTRDLKEFLGLVESNMFTCPSCGSNKTQHCQGRRKASADRLCIVVICSRCPHRWQV